MAAFQRPARRWGGCPRSSRNRRPLRHLAGTRRRENAYGSGPSYAGGARGGRGAGPRKTPGTFHLSGARMPPAAVVRPSPPCWRDTPSPSAGALLCPQRGERVFRCPTIRAVPKSTASEPRMTTLWPLALGADRCPRAGRPDAWHLACQKPSAGRSRANWCQAFRCCSWARG